MASLGDQYDGLILTKNDKPLVGLKSITFILKLYSCYWIVPKCKDLKFIVLESILVIEPKESVWEINLFNKANRREVLCIFYIEIWWHIWELKNQ